MKNLLYSLMITLFSLGSFVASPSLHAQPEPFVFMNTSNAKQSAWWLRLALDFQDLIFTKFYLWTSPVNNTLYQNTIATNNDLGITGGDIFVVSLNLSLDLLQRDLSSLFRVPIISQAVQNYFFAGILYFKALQIQSNPNAALANWLSVGRSLVNVLLTNSTHYLSLSSSEQSVISAQLNLFFDAFTQFQAESIRNYDPISPNLPNVIISNLASLNEAYQIGCYLDQTVYGNQPF